RSTGDVGELVRSPPHRIGMLHCNEPCWGSRIGQTRLAPANLKGLPGASADPTLLIWSHETNHIAPSDRGRHNADGFVQHLRIWALSPAPCGCRCGRIRGIPIDLGRDGRANNGYRGLIRPGRRHILAMCVAAIEWRIRMSSVLEIAKSCTLAYNEKNWGKVENLLAADAVYDEIGTHRHIRGTGRIIEAWKGWAGAIPDSRATFVRELAS